MTGLLSEADHMRVSEAIAAAESGTAGEIIAITSEQSDSYHDVGLHYALGIAFATMVRNLRDMAREISEGTNVLASSATDILTGTTQVATAAAETASATAETATTVEEVKQTATLSSQKARAVADGAGLP